MDPAAAGLEEPSSPVGPEERAARFGQQPATVLLTGLPVAGKTPIAHAIERLLFDRGRAVVVIDGQHMRHGLSRDLGFSADERSENLRRAAEVAKLFNVAGLVCIAAFVAPHAAVRRRAAEVVGHDRFFVVYVDAPEDWRRAHDDQGVYAKADSAEMRSFPGISAPYEAPEAPDLVLQSDKLTIDECARRVVELLEAKGVV